MTDLTPSSIIQNARESAQEPTGSGDTLPEALTLPKILGGPETGSNAAESLPSLHEHNRAKFTGVGPEGMGAVGLTMMFGGVVIAGVGAFGIFGQIITGAFMFVGIILFATGFFLFTMRDTV